MACTSKTLQKRQQHEKMLIFDHLQAKPKDDGARLRVVCDQFAASLSTRSFVQFSSIKFNATADLEPIVEWTLQKLQTQTNEAIALGWS